MVDGTLRIASGTNFIPGDYTVATFVSTTEITLDRDPSTGGAGASGVASFFDFRLLTASPLRDAGVGPESNIGCCDDTDVPALSNILTSDTLNDRAGTSSGGGGGVMKLTGLLS